MVTRSRGIRSGQLESGNVYSRTQRRSEQTIQCANLSKPILQYLDTLHCNAFDTIIFIRYLPEDKSTNSRHLNSNLEHAGETSNPIIHRTEADMSSEDSPMPLKQRHSILI